MTLKPSSFPQYPQESLSTPSVLGSLVHSGQLPTTTPALPSYWDQLLNWATTRNVTNDLYRLIDPTLLIEQPQAIGSVLSVLSTAQAPSILSHWAIESECALSLLHLSNEIDTVSATLPKYSPLPLEKAAAGYFTPVDRYYLLALLVARLPPVGPEEKLWFEKLRMWLLVHAMENAEHGIVLDNNLRISCAKLRLAHDGSDDWLQIFQNLGSKTLGFESLGLTLMTQCQSYLKSNHPTFKPSNNQRRLLEAIIAISAHRSDPDAATVISSKPLYQPTCTQIPPFWNSFRDDRTDDEPTELGRLLPGKDESHPDLLAVSVRPDDSYAHQKLHCHSILLSAMEDQHFLPWAWNRPNPYELVAFSDWIDQKPTAGSNTEIDAIRALAWVAVATGRTLRRTLDIAFGNSPGAEWQLSLDKQSLIRLPARRNPGWTPENDSATHWIAPLADMQTINLPGHVVNVLSALRSASQTATCLGETWNPPGGKSPESAFLDAMKSVAPRLTPGMLANLLPQRAFLATGDASFAKLIGSHPMSGLAGATAYATWPASAVQSSLNGASSSVSLTLPENSAHFNAQGSRLDVIEALLIGALRRAEQTLDELRDSGSTLDFHNAFTATVLVQLYAATAGRPIKDPYSSPTFFDLKAGFVFIEDKNSSKARAGRLTPLPPALVELMGKHYPAHLGALSVALQDAAPELAEEIRLLSNGKRSTRIPYFFLLSREKGLHWKNASESNIKDLCLFDWPLPLNLFRHRLATRLRAESADPEIIDALLGHAESGAATHGDGSFRIWLDDMTTVRPILERVFDSLGFQMVESWRSPPAPIRDTPAPNESPALFGSDARAVERRKRRRDAILSAKGIISAFLKGRELDSLSESELSELSLALLCNTKGLPHPLGGVRYGVLTALAEHSWKSKGKKIRFKRHYLQLDEDAGPFSESAPGSLETLRNLCGCARELEASISKLRPGKQAAAMLASILAIVTARIAHQQLINDLLAGRNHRLIRVRKQYYLEHCVGLDRTDPCAPVQRYRISFSTARLINIALKRSNEPSLERSARREVLLPFASLLVETGRIDDRWSPRDLINALIVLVDQANAQEFPGAIAGYLGGRVLSSALDWRDWLRLRWNEYRYIPQATTAPPAIRDEFACAILSAPPAGEPETLHAYAREFFSELRSDIRGARGVLTSAPTPPDTRRAMASAIKTTIAKWDGKVGRAPLLLGHWLKSLMTRRVKKDYLKMRSIHRYFAALSPAFEGVAYAFDPDLADEEAMTNAYREILESRALKNQAYAFNRLVDFHRWARSQMDFEDPTWSELPSHNQVAMGDPGIFTEKDYLDALALLLDCGPDQRSDQDQAAFLILCAYRFGLRGADALGLLRQDWIALGDFVIVVVQDNPHRALKVKKTSRRAVPLIDPLTPLERELVARILRVAEATSGDDTSTPLFARSGAQFHNVARIKGLALDAVKTATGNPDANIHRARHSAANRVMLALLGQPSVAWKDLKSTETRTPSRAIDLLLGRDNPTRRSAWATARFLGHAGPSSTFGSYLHFLSDWAEELVGLDHENSRVLANAIDLEQFPLFSPMRRLSAGSSREGGKILSVVDALKILRLLARGHSSTAISSWLRIPHEQAVRITSAIRKIDGAIRWPNRESDRNEENTIEILGHVGAAAWTRLMVFAETMQPPIPANSDDILEIGKIHRIVGSSRQLLAWRKQHFNTISHMLSAWGIDAASFVFYKSHDDQTLRKHADEAGFSLVDPRSGGKRLGGIQIDTAFDDDEKILQVRRRCALAFNETSTGLIRNRIELLIALLCWCAVNTNQAEFHSNQDSEDLVPIPV